jgi:hypothetical protein
LSSIRTWSFLFKPAALGAFLLLATAAVACGDGGEETSVPTATPPPAITVGPVPTVDAAVPLAEYRSADMGFSIGYPEGWKVEVPGGIFSAFTWSISGRPIAQVTLLCNQGENMTVDGLIASDRQIIASAGGSAPSEPTPIEIAGLPGKQTTYETNFGGLTAEQAAVYVVSGECGWRIGLATYGPGTREPYLPLFDRILASFRPS